MRFLFPMTALVILSTASISHNAEHKLDLSPNRPRQLNLHNKTGQKLLIRKQKNAHASNPTSGAAAMHAPDFLECTHNVRAEFNVEPDDRIEVVLKGIEAGHLSFIDCRAPDYGATTYKIQTKNKWNGCSRIATGLVFALVKD